MNKDYLQKFCSTDSFRVNINKPFSQGEYTYATNGHIIVRVPRIEGIGEQEKSDKFKPVEPEKLFAAIKDFPYHPIPDIPEPWAHSEASGRLYNNLYLSWLKELPDCVLAEAEGYEPGHFKFTGGDGLLMPSVRR